jgi:hypothetical protein
VNYVNTRTLTTAALLATLLGCHHGISAETMVERIGQAATSPEAMRFVQEHLAVDITGASNMARAMASVPANMAETLARAGLRELQDPTVTAGTLRRVADQVGRGSCHVAPADDATSSRAAAMLATALPPTIDPSIAQAFEPYHVRARAFTDFHPLVCASLPGRHLVIGRDPALSSHEFVLLLLFG